MNPAKKLELVVDNEDDRETLRPPMSSQSGLITLTIQDILSRVEQNVNPNPDISYRLNYPAFLHSVFTGIHQNFLKPALLALIKDNPTDDYKRAAIMYLKNYESEMYENCICLSTLNDFKRIVLMGNWKTRNGIYQVHALLKMLAQTSKNYSLALPDGDLIEFNGKN